MAASDAKLVSASVALVVTGSAYRFRRAEGRRRRLTGSEVQCHLGIRAFRKHCGLIKMARSGSPWENHEQLRSFGLNHGEAAHANHLRE